MSIPRLHRKLRSYLILGPEMQEREQLKLLKSSEERVKYPFAFSELFPFHVLISLHLVAKRILLLCLRLSNAHEDC